MTRLATLATYPVLEEARVWLRGEGPGLDDLVTDFVYNRARDRARVRVRAALSGDALEDPVLLNDIDAEMELLSHPLARQLVAAVDENVLVRRFAVAEAKRASGALERASGELVAAVADALDVPYRRAERDGSTVFGLHFVAYMARAPNEAAWHLVRRDPDAGTVWLTKEDFVRLLEEVYKRRLEEELAGRAKQVPALVHEVFREEIERLREQAVEVAARYKKADFSAVVPTVFPPCMKRILQDMHDHVNVPHMGRFALVTFLHTLGMDSEDILKFFSSVPDFDPEKSRYQIEHITGKGGPTEYTPPGCAAMQSYGVCPLEERDDVCANVKHPLSYYRKTLWRHENAPTPPSDEDAAASGADQAKGGAPTGQMAPGRSTSDVAGRGPGPATNQAANRDDALAGGPTKTTGKPRREVAT